MCIPIHIFYSALYKAQTVILGTSSFYFLVLDINHSCMKMVPELFLQVSELNVEEDSRCVRVNASVGRNLRSSQFILHPNYAGKEATLAKLPARYSNRQTCLVPESPEKQHRLFHTCLRDFIYYFTSLYSTHSFAKNMLVIHLNARSGARRQLTRRSDKPTMLTNTTCDWLVQTDKTHARTLKLQWVESTACYAKRTSV